LLEQLGYRADREAVRRRLERLSIDSGTGVLVAVDGTRVVGVIAYALFASLEHERPQCRITTLVVDERARRQGVASGLLAAVEEIARRRSCRRLEVTTRPERDAALGFYGDAGFEERPRRLIKPLPD
jgi:ribosomal protein S18 acetylase RimI-like enzyme